MNVFFTLGWEWFNVKQSLTVGDDFKNQIVIVDFFTYCCINCMHILPDLHALEEKYPSDQTGVIIVCFHYFAINIVYLHVVSFYRLVSIVPNLKMKKFLRI